MTVVPGDSAPENDAGLGLVPVTDIVKLPAVAVPPLSLTTCLMTMRCAGWSSLVMVQVFCSPAAIVPEQPTEVAV